MFRLAVVLLLHIFHTNLVTAASTRRAGGAGLDISPRSAFEYKITHTTGTGRYNAAAPKNSDKYIFKLIGTNGETGEHSCVADRGKGVTDSCTITDSQDIGQLTALVVENKGDDMWVFTAISVEKNGVLQGSSTEKKRVDDYETHTVFFKVGGGWGDWSDWSECSADCGGGTQTRSKECNNPAPVNGGDECEGQSIEIQECNSQSCPVDGGWSDYGEWSACTKECGGGEQTRERVCNNPAPAYGGAECQGTSSESRSCNEQPCPVDGGWSDYGEWSACTKECGGGEQTRERVCNNPAPAHGGAECQGTSSESQSCNEQPCPVDGGWSNYGDWSACSEECGGGEQTRERECNNPAPENGGADCQGSSLKTRSCNEQPCPVDGGWGAWSGWSQCSAECDGGIQTKSRKCNNPAPANGGADCQGESTKTRECNTQACEVVYRITHTTGTGSHHDGATSGAYMFTLIGSDGKTAEHNCRADRSKGATDSCTIRDTAKIGKLKSMKVKNTSNNKWVFVAASVEVDGVLRGRWAGSTTVNDYQTKTIVFTYIGDQVIEYEITHVTGTGSHDSGANSGMYEFQFKGADNPYYTGWYNCKADRSKGATGTCVIRDAAELGEIEQAGIKNKGDNTWVFKSFKVKVNGKVVAKWSGSQKVGDYKTVWINF